MIPDSHKNSVRTFEGVMDKDTTDALVRPGDYRHAVGIRNGYGARPGAIILDKGNIEVEADLPASGSNVCVGQYEDKFCQTIIYMVYNSGGDHRIYRYYPDNVDILTPYGEIFEIARGSALAFTGELITQIRLVDNRFLYWTDARSGKLEISGTPPYVIDIQKSDLNGKLRQYNLYHTDGDYSGTYTFIRYDENGDTIATSTFIFSPLPADFDAFLDAMVVKLNGPNDGDRLLAYRCGDCKIIIDMVQVGYTCTLTHPDGKVVLVPINFYPTLEQHHLDLIKHPPIYEPIVTYQTDGEFGYNFVSNDMFQFRIRYYFADGSPSAFGPISNIPLPLSSTGDVLKSLNYIRVDFNDLRLNDSSFLNNVRRIEVAFRKGNTGNFMSADILDVCEIDYKVNAYRFYNDKIYATVASDESGASAELQALKLFDNVPQLCGAMELIMDEDGNTRLAVGAGLENYTSQPCDKIDLALEYPAVTTDCELITITGRIDVYRQAYQTGSFDAQSWEPADEGDPTNPDVIALDGFVVYLAGTPYYGISDNFTVSPTGEFRIENVPMGKYVLRVASYRCRFDNSIGARYNLNNGLEWQKTSSPLIDCAGSALAHGLNYERQLDLSAVSGTFDLVTESGYGTITVQDFRKTTQYVLITEGYLIDNEGNTGAASLKASKGVELQNVAFEMAYYFSAVRYATSITRISDANGYFYAIINVDPGDGSSYSTAPRIETHSFYAYDTVDTEVGDEKEYTTVQAYYFTNSLDGKDIFYGIENETAIAGNPLMNYPWVMQNQDSVFSANNKTYVTGTVLNDADNPVEGVVVVISRNGQQTTTDENGEYSIPVHVAWDPTEINRRVDQLYFHYPEDPCYTYPFSEDNIRLDIGFFPADYNSTTILEGQDTVITLLTESILTAFKTLKRGGFYQVGIVYEDRANRKSTVVAKAEIKIPFHTEDGRYGPWYVLWSINHIPPLWATHYRVVRTRDATYRRYLQWIVEEVRYVTIADADADPVTSTFGSGSHVLLKINPEFLPISDSNPVIYFYRQNEYVAFQPVAGDRVRLILDETFAVLDEFYDFPIIGYFTESDNYYAVIENPDPLFEIKNNYLVEFYTPKKSDEVVLYEQGDTYPILDPGTENRLHGGQRQDQTSLLPATGYLSGGDVYWRVRNFVVGSNIDGNVQTENQNLSDTFDSFNEDIGRPNVYDPSFRQTFYYNRIRVSDVFVPNSQLNGLSSFRSLEYQDINRDYGAIQYLEMLGQVLVAICEFKVQPIYVSKDQIVDLSGSTLIGRTDRLLNLANEVVGEYGTQFPGSVAILDGALFAMDALKGTPWMFSQAGQQPINMKMVDYFNQIGRSARNKNIAVSFLGAVDRQFNEYLLSYTIGATSATLSYSIDKRGWPTFHPFVGENYSRIGKVFVAFDQGKLWVHGVNSIRMNYFDVQETALVQVIINDDPTSNKDFYNLSILSKYPWNAPYITTPINNQYPAGQLSRLKSAHFSSYGGRFDAELKRDINDPAFSSITPDELKESTALTKGRVLKNNILLIQLSPELSYLDHELVSASVEYTPSMDTKP